VVLSTHRPALSAQIWIRLLETPTMKERQLVSEVLKSWFTMGRLTAFNGMNLQVSAAAMGSVGFTGGNAFKVF
jgi:hypothetical protein